MLWLLVIVLLILWMGGLVLDVVGGLIHGLLVLAVIVAAVSVIRAERHKPGQSSTD